MSIKIALEWCDHLFLKSRNLIKKKNYKLFDALTMNHNKIIKFCLKYFNITLGILMVIVLSLNIELIFHNKRIEKTSFNNKNTSLLNSNGEPLNFTKFFNNNIDFFDKCVNCSKEAINLMTRLNGKFVLIILFKK